MRNVVRTIVGVAVGTLILATAAPELPVAQARGKFFKTGQAGRMMFSGKGFNKTGGGLLFNHPANIATDGERLVLADRNNNRVLIWTTLPDGNVEPDLVIGQKNFKTNNPGTGRHQLNWPSGVATADGMLIVADSYNDRLLIWTTFPTKNAQPADLEINLQGMIDPNSQFTPAWPWAVWTDGTKLISAVTFANAVFIWNDFPAADDDRADIFLTGKKGSKTDFGTPRTIGTDGKTFLVIGDHNAFSDQQGNFFWKRFPKRDESYTFFSPNPFGPELMWGGELTPDGKLVMIAAPGLAIWNKPPTKRKDPDLIVGKKDPDSPCNEEGYALFDGDGSGLAIAPDGRIFVSLYNANKVVVYNETPTTANQCPDFALGAPDIDTNTLETEGFITNPVPASDGKSLIVTSDFDRTLSAWKRLPKKNGQKADVTVDLDFAPWDNALHGGSFVAGGFSRVDLWTPPPTNGEAAILSYGPGIGPVQFRDIRGVALDSQYLYVADQMQNRVWGWPRFPGLDDPPAFELQVDGPSRLSSDGEYLVINQTLANQVTVYRVADLAARVADPVVIPPAGAEWRINLSQGVLAADGALFVADTNQSRVLAWSDIDDAIAGNVPEVVIGANDLDDDAPGIGKNTLFWPGAVAYAKKRLWVGEFKFSHRIVEYRH